MTADAGLLPGVPRGRVPVWHGRQDTGPGGGHLKDVGPGKSAPLNRQDRRDWLSRSHGGTGIARTAVPINLFHVSSLLTSVISPLIPVSTCGRSALLPDSRGSMHPVYRHADCTPWLPVIRPRRNGCPTWAATCARRSKPCGSVRRAADRCPRRGQAGHVSVRQIGYVPTDLLSVRAMSGTFFGSRHDLFRGTPALVAGVSAFGLAEFRPAPGAPPCGDEDETR